MSEQMLYVSIGADTLSGNVESLRLP
jgi:hypothetical protein